MSRSPVAAALVVMLVLTGPGNGVAADTGFAPWQAVGDTIPAPLTGAAPSAARGRAVALDINRGNCLICHQVPGEPGERFQGAVGPALHGVGARLSRGQVRLRLADATRLNPDTVMPSYHRVSGLSRVDGRYAGRPVLDAGEIEDVIEWLMTFR